jgi:hypothetical protein
LLSNWVYSCLAALDFCGAKVNRLPGSAVMVSSWQMLRRSRSPTVVVELVSYRYIYFVVHLVNPGLKCCYSILHRWADKLCPHCNIFIYVRHIWIKPVLCSRMVSYFTLNTQMLTGLTQCTSKWKSFQTCGSNSRCLKYVYFVV